MQKWLRGENKKVPAESGRSEMIDAYIITNIKRSIQANTGTTFKEE